MADRGFALAVSSCWLNMARMNEHDWLVIEQYALTEASYTVVRLLQSFDTLENADPHPRIEPIKLSNLTMSHDLGVPVRLYLARR